MKIYRTLDSNFEFNGTFDFQASIAQFTSN
jgi:hypothetical protein